MKESIQAIKTALKALQDANDPRLILWRQDERKGVQTAISQWEKQQAKQAQLHQKYQEMLEFETLVTQAGYQAIAGIDEVGRGPLAGPVVTAAVILPTDCEILGLNDSKQLSLKKREELFAEIQQQALAIGIGVIDAPTIDQVNIYQATKLAMIQAVEKLQIQPDYLLIDAMKLDLAIPQESLIKGDARSVSIAAASIIAKVTRDRMMVAYDQTYPGYGFAKNAGYGTKEHLAGLATQGITPIHRKSFAPIKDLSF